MTSPKSKEDTEAGCERVCCPAEKLGGGRMQPYHHLSRIRLDIGSKLRRFSRVNHIMRRVVTFIATFAVLGASLDGTALADNTPTAATAAASPPRGYIPAPPPLASAIIFLP